MNAQTLWQALYSTLTTSQIEQALRISGQTHEDWMAFRKRMNDDRDYKKMLRDRFNDLFPHFQPHEGWTNEDVIKLFESDAPIHFDASTDGIMFRISDKWVTVATRL